MEIATIAIIERIERGRISFRDKLFWIEFIFFNMAGGE